MENNDTEHLLYAIGGVGKKIKDSVTGTTEKETLIIDISDIKLNENYGDD